MGTSHCKPSVKNVKSFIQVRVPGKKKVVCKSLFKYIIYIVFSCLFVLISKESSNGISQVMTFNGSLDKRFGQLILASASPRRAQILSQIGFSFTVIPSTVEEVFDDHDPIEVSRDLALKKASEVARSYPEQIVIGADTVVYLDRQILGKPVSADDACTMLRTLSGKTHEVFTAFALVHRNKNRQIVEVERTEVTFRQLSEDDILSYVRSGEPMDKAGAYGIQDRSAVFVERINGDFYNVVGLPVSKLYACLQKEF